MSERDATKVVIDGDLLDALRKAAFLWASVLESCPYMEDASDSSITGLFWHGRPGKPDDDDYANLTEYGQLALPDFAEEVPVLPSDYRFERYVAEYVYFVSLIEAINSATSLLASSEPQP